jgi:hypothetical protein
MQFADLEAAKDPHRRRPRSMRHLRPGLSQPSRGATSTEANWVWMRETVVPGCASAT